MIRRLSFSTRFFYFVLLWCVFSFKLLVGGVGEAGLRMDDLLLAIVCALLVLRGNIVKIPRSPAFRAYLIFVTISLCSAVWNALAGRVGFIYSMLFVARLLEYMIFYYLGYILQENGIRVWRGLQVYFYVLCVVVPLQMLHLLPTASQFDVSRASGNTNGPYELAAVAAFFFCYFGYRKAKKMRAAGSIVLLLSTASRITTVGTVIEFVSRYFSRSRSKVKAVTVILLALLIVATGIAWISSGQSGDGDVDTLGSRLGRASTLFSADYGSLYANIPIYATSADYIDGTFADATESANASESDASGMIRAFRWSALIKSSLAHYDSILIGMGPSFGSAAVDGYYVRVFIETGIAGLLAFFLFLRALLKPRGEQSASFREFAVILILTACFIDIFASYKTMLLLWLWNGMNEAEWRSKRKCA
jgi:hypothetical protein